MFFALIVSIALGGFLNSTNWFIITKSIIEYYFPYLFLFLSISRIELSEKEQGRLIKLCYFLIFLQIPVVLMQSFGGDYSGADMISGTIADSDESGGTGINAVLGAFLFSVCMSGIAIKGLTRGYLVLGLLAFVPLFVGGARFGFILMGSVPFVLILSMIWVGYRDAIKASARLLVLIFIFAVVVYSAFAYLLPKYMFAEYLNLDVFIDREALLEGDSDPGSQRLWGYVILFKVIFKDWSNILFGIGSGALIESRAFDTRVIKSVEAYFPFGAPDGVSIMLSIGIIGLFLAIIILIYGPVWLKKYLQIETCPFMKMNAYAFIPITAVFLQSLAYTSAWSSQIGLTYWVVAGVLMKRYSLLSEAIHKPNSSAG
jgi:hypothetical protein